MLKWAEYLNKEKDAGYAVLHIGFAYFECIASFLKGEELKWKRQYVKQRLKAN
jgi:hypothetical protein